MGVACLLVAACSDDDSSVESTATEAGSGVADDGVDDDGVDDDGPAVTTSGATETSADGTDGDSGPPPDPMLAPGVCGPGPDGAGCGWADAAAAPCPAEAMAGGTCDAQTLRTCCLDVTTLLRCQCLDNACDDQWYATDCTHDAGAGACGWQADLERYVCGGENGEDPSTPMACPEPDPTSGEGCEGAPLGTTCCDADGNARLCTDVGSNGNPNWQITDCDLSD